MVNSKRVTVVGVFSEREQAEQAVGELGRAGFSKDQIGYIVRHDETKPYDPNAREEPTTGQGAAAGAVTGGVVGGLLAAATGLIPGIGPVIAAGLLASSLFGVAAGAAAGGLVGALIGMEVPEEEVPYYEQAFYDGRILLTVRAGTRSDEAAAIMQRCGAYTDPHMPTLMRPQG